ncbi:site-specific integrase [Shewanella profunda]|uniref:site-specific integrase n=1 Tax=Shewanella TaxID=22 RepID=UPI00200F25EC|nr:MULTISPECIES: site-specific integrase [Shewanella]MCL1091415.1 site-specific integrase [Shewanella profunda]MCS6174903.1 site-specific integrase [Shewanella baltica]MCS6239275.1 site-specific integrase [Shewanella baltica]MCZ2337871.1 site-specific integrase [Chitinophagales bacterium]
MKVVDYIFSEGERRSLLVSEDSRIDFWSTLYVTAELRQDHKQTSIKKELYSIKLLRKWEQLHTRDLLAEIRQLNFPSRETIKSIKHFCGISSKAENSKSAKVVSFTKLAKTPSALDTVDKNYQYQRMIGINKFLGFCAWELCKFKPNAAELRREIEAMSAQFKAHYPKGLSNLSKATHAEADHFKAFLEVAHPNHPQNPFSNFEIKLRNYLLIQILYWTGCRPSETLSLTLDDIGHDIDQPALRFIRRHDDINDPRKVQPTLKTQEREINIPPALYTDLEYYIRVIRPTFNRSKSHPYIFVHHKGGMKGSAMTDKAFSEAVIPKLKAVDKMFTNIQRRGFRIYFNERLSAQIDMHNEGVSEQILVAEKQGLYEEVKVLKSKLIKDGDEIDMRMMLNGHSSPDSARPYLNRFAERKARDIHKRMMLDISSATKEIKNGRSS